MKSKKNTTTNKSSEFVSTQPFKGTQISGLILKERKLQLINKHPAIQ